MIDGKHLGDSPFAFSLKADAWRLRLYVEAVGETNPVYVDESAAHDAGHPSLPLPPTFLCALEFEQLDAQWPRLLGFRPDHVLHAEQSFTYYCMAYVGDVLRFEPHVSRTDGDRQDALCLIVRETRVSNQREEHVADLRSVLVLRQDTARE